MNVYLYGRVEVRVSDEEARIIADVEHNRMLIHHSLMKRYRLLMKDIAKVADWKNSREQAALTRSTGDAS